MGTPRYVAYIDESGDEGFNFAGGSSAWFVLSAAVFRKASELNDVKLVDSVRAAVNAARAPSNPPLPANKPLHFRNLKHDARRFYAAEVGKAKVVTISICAHKPGLAGDHYKEKSKLYFYATRLLLERLCRLCYDLSKPDCLADIHFSNRASMNYDRLRGYIEMLQMRRNELRFGDRPGVIDVAHIYTSPAGVRMGLQVADAVASSHFFALEPNRFGQTETAYMQAMAHKAYVSKGKVVGNGVKLMPASAEAMYKTGSILTFLNAPG